VLLQGIPQRDGGTLVEQNAHLGGSHGALFCVLQDSADLFESHAGKPLHELRCHRTVLEILEQCCNRNARASKDPRSADTIWIAFDCGAGGPVNHGRDASTVASRRLTSRFRGRVSGTKRSAAPLASGPLQVRSGDIVDSLVQGHG